MIKIRDMQDDIVRIKQENGIFIAAHSYQAREIIEVADFTGDSFQLSMVASGAEQRTILLCGVRFMAETVKIIAPDKTVLLANPAAGCPMAELFDKEWVTALKRANPGCAVVAYINTTAELKTVCDVCVTSSTAAKIVNRLPVEDILFIPDQNLGAYVARQAPDKNLRIMKGECHVHAAVNVHDVKSVRSAHPSALLLVHPECIPGVTALADFIGSTSAIMDYAVKSSHTEFIIGTEMSIIENLQYKCPNKNFYPLSKRLICPNMKLTTLADVLRCVKGAGGEEITLDEETIRAARVCIDKMIELGG